MFDTAEILHWINAYFKLRNMGQAGILISEEYKIFKEEGNHEWKENIFDFCIRKAKEALI